MKHMPKMSHTLQSVGDTLAQSKKQRSTLSERNERARAEIVKLRGDMEEHGQMIQQDAQHEADKRTSQRQQRIAVYDWVLLQFNRI